MRAADALQGDLFAFPLSERIPARHPLRAVRSAAVAVGEELRPDLDALYRPGGARPAPPPEQILRALMLWAIYDLPSEARLVEELDYHLLYRWFVGLAAETPVWRLGTFRANRRRILAAPAGREFLVRAFARIPRGTLGRQRFAVNWPLVEAWCGQRRLVDLGVAGS